MREAVVLETGDPALRLRLQSPTLTVGPSHGVGLQEEGKETVSWKANAGGVVLAAQCLPSSDREWRLTFVLRGGATDAEVRVAYPYLFYHFEPFQRVRIFNPIYGGVLEPYYAPLNISYPGPATFCLTAASGTKRTVAAGLFNKEQRHVHIRHTPAQSDGQIRFVFERVRVPRGENVEMPEMFIRTAEDWPEAFSPYREFAMGAFPRRRDTPPWLAGNFHSETRRAHCIAPFYPPKMSNGIWIFDDEGRRRTIDELKAEVDEACADGAGQGYSPLFYQFGWWASLGEIRGLFMFDSTTGDYTAAHDLTRAIIDYIHARGARTYLYTNAISIGDETAAFRTKPELLLRDAAGMPVQNGAYPLYILCPGSPAAQGYWDEVLQFVLNDLDADGIFLDQVGGGFPPQYCYAGDHHHEHPDCYGKDMVKLVDFIGRRAREIKADSFISGELVLDSRSPLLDETHGPGYASITAKPPGTKEERAKAKPSEYYIFTRYLAPQIRSFAKGPDDLMDGAGGSCAWPEWRDYGPILESSVSVCRTEPAGVLAYLFGPLEGRALLAVRTHGESRAVAVELPPSMQIQNPLPAAVSRDDNGNILRVTAEISPRYYPLNLAIKSRHDKFRPRA